MPAVSEKQRRAMYAAAEGKSRLGIPQEVGEEFVGKRKDALAQSIMDAIREHYAQAPQVKAHEDAEVCAGILLRAPGPQFLLLKQADEPYWVQPGGHAEPGETALETAIRETQEETGATVKGEPLLLRRSQSDGIDYTTFLLDVKAFNPVLSGESTDAAWAMADALPESTHPEVAKSIQLASGNELDIAKAIRGGELASPQRYENIWLFDVRITGTGTSYRTALEEFVYRPPEDFLSDDFVERCNGLPVVFEHPESGELDTNEYRQRAIGTITLPYVKGNEVWGVAKIYDDDAAVLMQSTHASTSPTVMFRFSGSAETVDLGNGQTILIEGKPSYLESLAVCEEGVWDKGGEPKGVNLSEESAMSDEMVPAWADEMGKRLDAMSTRLDAMEAGRKDSFDGLEKKAGGEGSDKERAENKEPNDESEPVQENDEAGGFKPPRADGEEEIKEEVIAPEGKRAGDSQVSAAQARENADLKRRIADMDARMNRMLRPLSAGDRDELARVQKRADSLAQMFGDSVTPPLAGETPIEYRKRMAARFQKYSDSTKGIKIEKLDDASFGVIEDRIFNDAQEAALNPAEPVAGRLIPIRTQDDAGRTITRYVGDSKAWMRPFIAKGMSIRIADANAFRQGVRS